MAFSQQPRLRHKLNMRGESLVESLVAILVLSAVAIAAFTGLTTIVKSTSANRDLGAAEPLLRSAAEFLQDPEVELIGCAANPSSYAGSYALPPGSNGLRLEVQSVRSWSGSGSAPGMTWQLSSSAPTDFVSQCNERGLQLIRLAAVRSSTDETVATIEVLKRAS
jgi:hypothetical protein